MNREGRSVAAQGPPPPPVPATAALTPLLIAMLIVAPLAAAPLAPAHLAGWALMAASIAVVGLHPALRAVPGRGWVVGLPLAAHHAVALLTAFGVAVPGLEGDAAGLHAFAANDAGNLVIGLDYRFYRGVLALLYGVGGPSQLFGAELSVFAFVLTCIVLVRLMDRLGMTRGRGIALLLVGLSPAAVVLGSATLRESWLLLGVVTASHLGLRIREHFAWRDIAALAFVLAALGLLHRVMIFYGFLMLVLVLVMPADGRMWSGARLRRGALALMAVAGAAVVVGAALYVSAGGRELVLSLVSKNPLAGVEAYRAYLEQAYHPRTSYGWVFDASSPAAAAASLFKAYASYMFAPPPWRVQRPVDLYPMLAAWLRLALLVASLALWRSARGAQRRRLGFLLLVYFTLTFTWSLGSTNFGQALRHHVLTGWIPAVLGMWGLASWWRRREERGTD